MESVFLANINNVDFPIITGLLVKHEIDFFVKNVHGSSLNAGWVFPGGLFDEKMLFVNVLQLKKAKELLKLYISDTSN